MAVSQERQRVLRVARTRALLRLRVKYEADFQQFMDEEIEKLGERPRGYTVPYVPRNRSGE